MTTPFDKYAGRKSYKAVWHSKKLNLYEKAILDAILKGCRTENPHEWRYSIIDYFGDYLSVSRNTVKRALKRLIDDAYLKRTLSKSNRLASMYSVTTKVFDEFENDNANKSDDRSHRPDMDHSDNAETTDHGSHRAMVSNNDVVNEADHGSHRAVVSNNDVVNEADHGSHRATHGSHRAPKSSKRNIPKEELNIGEEKLHFSPSSSFDAFGDFDETQSPFTELELGKDNPPKNERTTTELNEEPKEDTDIGRTTKVAGKGNKRLSDKQAKKDYKEAWGLFAVIHKRVKQPRDKPNWFPSVSMDAIKTVFDQNIWGKYSIDEIRKYYAVCADEKLLGAIDWDPNTIPELIEIAKQRVFEHETN
jgi:DNA-binding MarR family transcriptional regulator